MSAHIRLFAVLALAAGLLLLALPAAAQEATPDAVVVAVEEPDDPAFAALLALTTAVYFAVEQLKPLINQIRARVPWGDDAHQFIVRAVAGIVALVLIFSIPNEANIIVALGLTWQLPDWAATLITALAVSGGSTLLYALRQFFRLTTPIPPVTARPPYG